MIRAMRSILVLAALLLASCGDGDPAVIDAAASDAPTCAAAPSTCDVVAASEPACQAALDCCAGVQTCCTCQDGGWTPVTVDCVCDGGLPYR
jgi:hypothetical protein